MRKNQNIRRCNHCGVSMTEGYCIDSGNEYYCSDACIFNAQSNLTHGINNIDDLKELYDECVNDGNTDYFYWTQWESVNFD